MWVRGRPGEGSIAAQRGGSAAPQRTCQSQAGPLSLSDALLMLAVAALWRPDVADAARIVRSGEGHGAAGTSGASPGPWV